ncbi:MAG: hypothetical protein QNJ31_01915 [Candidatus Caenarcaniphilales bacterium]|nr:hypothetical protein [Candidatus Caenarcaniphilales bacterium]
MFVSPLINPVALSKNFQITKKNNSKKEKLNSPPHQRRTKLRQEMRRNPTYMEIAKISEEIGDTVSAELNLENAIKLAYNAAASNDNNALAFIINQFKLPKGEVIRREAIYSGSIKDENNNKVYESIFDQFPGKEQSKLGYLRMSTIIGKDDEVTYEFRLHSGSLDRMLPIGTKLEIFDIYSDLEPVASITSSGKDPWIPISLLASKYYNYCVRVTSRSDGNKLFVIPSSHIILDNLILDKGITNSRLFSNNLPSHRLSYVDYLGK